MNIRVLSNIKDDLERWTVIYNETSYIIQTLSNEGIKNTKNAVKSPDCISVVEGLIQKKLNNGFKECTDLSCNYDDFSVSIIDMEIYLLGYNGDDEVINIPEGITVITQDAFNSNNKITKVVLSNTVKRLNDKAFYKCTALKEIVLTESLLNIGARAFYMCQSLVNIDLPKNLITLDSWAFEACNSLTNIIIPDSIDKISTSCFSRCSSLKAITLPNTITAIYSYAFSHCTSLEEISIPDDVTILDNGCFAWCSSLTNIKLPNNLEVLGYSMFSGVTSLTNISLPETITEIEAGAFNGCTSLKEITLGDNLQIIRDNVFAGCTSLTSITIPQSTKKIGKDVFKDCTNLNVIANLSRNLTLYNSYYLECIKYDVANLDNTQLKKTITKIKSKPLELDTLLSSNDIKIISFLCKNNLITIDKISTSIDTLNLNSEVKIYLMDYISNASDDIKNENKIISERKEMLNLGVETPTLKEIKVYWKCKKIDDEILFTEYLGNDSKISFPCNIEGITKYTFTLKLNDTIEEIIFEEGITSLTFKNKNNILGVSCCLPKLNKVILPKSLKDIITTELHPNTYFTDDLTKNINNDDFVIIENNLIVCNKKDITTYTLPDNIETICANAFYKCVDLTNIKLNNKLKKICENAFRQCEKLDNVQLPDSIESIENHAFWNCKSLVNLTIPKTIKAIGEYAFSETKITSCHFFNDTNILSAMYSSCNGLTNVLIPDNIEILDPHAFSYCENLETIQFPKNLKEIKDNAFFFCKSIKEVTFPENLTTIGDAAFEDCSNLMSIKLNDNLTSIGKGAFRGCWDLTEVHIPKSVTTIGAQAFFYTSLKNVYITKELHDKHKKVFAAGAKYTYID